MADTLFKPLSGPKANLTNQPITPGHMYLTVDDGKLYFDVALSNGTKKRIAINPTMTAQQIIDILGYTPVKEDKNTIYEFEVENNDTLVLASSD